MTDEYLVQPAAQVLIATAGRARGCRSEFLRGQCSGVVVSEG